MKKSGVKQASTAIIALLAASLLTGCGLGEKTTANRLPPESVAVETVHTSSQAIGETYIGAVAPYIQTSLAPGASGQLAELDVRPGTLVQAGQVLARLDGVTAVPAQNAADQASITLQNAKTQYADALAMYNDNINAEQQVTNAQNALDEQTAALQSANVNYQKTKLQVQAAEGGGATPQDLESLQTNANYAEQAVTAAKQQLQLSQSNLAILEQNLADAKQEYGAITNQQVQQAYANYQNELSAYNSWQSGAYVGSNPYYNAMEADQTVWSALSGGYSSLQTTQQQYNQGVQAAATATSALAQAQANQASAQKALEDANPTQGTNLDQQNELSLQAAKATLNQAQAQYNAAVATLKLAKLMSADKTQAKQTLDNALDALRQNQVNAVTANRTLAAQIRNDEVISPISGYVQAVGAQIGQSVGPQTNLVTIGSTTPVMATVQVPETYIGQLQKGSRMTVYVPTFNESLSGHVLDIHPQLDSSTNQYPVDIVVDTPANGLLPGMAVQASLQGKATKPVILVPADSVLSLQSGAEEVFVVRHGHAYSQIVQVGDMSSTEYEITSGLKVGGKLVVAGQNLLSDGDAVRVVSGGTTA